MGYSRRYRRVPGGMSINLTPMVDVIFILTIFFMLVSRFSSAEQVSMELPKPDHSRATVAHLPVRVVINCRLARPSDPSSSPVLYSVGPNRPEPLELISERLGTMKQATPGLQVVVRADRRIRYADVRAVMRAIAEHDIEMLNVVAHVAEGE